MRYLPAPGLHVLNPVTGAVITEDGVEVGPHDFDLHRMVLDCDLVEAEAKAVEVLTRHDDAPAAAPAAFDPPHDDHEGEGAVL